MIAAILAGGASRRMGAPKATVSLRGRPLIAYPLAAAAAAGLDPVVVAKAATPLPELDAPVWLEPDEPQHPLTGIVAALERAGEPIVALACDQPWLTGDLLARLAAGPGTVAVRVAGRLEPLPARLEPADLDSLRAALAARAPLRAALEALDPHVVEDVEPRLVAGVNTPEALAYAQGMNAEDWLAAFASELGRPAPTAEEIDAVLRLASVAAHASERRAAPIACWLAATAGMAPDEARAVAERLA